MFSGCSRKEHDVRVLKLAHALDTEHPVHKAMVFMADKVKEKSQGRMRIDIYPSEQLGSERECIEQLQVGALSIAKASSSAIEGFVSKMKVLGLPYLFRDSEHFWNALLGPASRSGLKDCVSTTRGRGASIPEIDPLKARPTSKG
jgi:TRAP-type C4-dicarboxylate transport system substrate-binding protein